MDYCYNMEENIEGRGSVEGETLESKELYYEKENSLKVLYF